MSSSLFFFRQHAILMPNIVAEERDSMDLKEFDRSAQELRLLNLLVWKDGKEILRRDYDGEIRRNQYSASKSFTSAAVGIAQREGLLSLEEKLADVFAEEIPDEPDEFLQEARVRIC